MEPINNKVVSVIAGIALAVTMVYGSMAFGSNDLPVGGNGGSPSPVFNTATATATEIATPIPTVSPTEYAVELPNTGAGTTANEHPQRNHTGWHYSSWCDSGWWLWYRWYSYNYNHTSIGQQQFGNYGRCWF